MNPLEKATALLEAGTDEDLARLCGVERLALARMIRRWDAALIRTRPQPDAPKAGVRQT